MRFGSPARAELARGALLQTPHEALREVTSGRGKGLTVPSVGILPANTAGDPGEVSGPPAARRRQGRFGHGAVVLLRARGGIGVNSSPICSRALSSLRLHLSHRSAFEGDLLCVEAREGTYQNERVLVKGKFNFLYKAVVEAVIRAGAAEAVQRGQLAKITSAGTRPHSSQPRALMTFSLMSCPHTQPLPHAAGRTTCIRATIL